MRTDGYIAWEKKDPSKHSAPSPKSQLLKRKATAIQTDLERTFDIPKTIHTTTQKNSHGLLDLAPTYIWNGISYMKKGTSQTSIFTVKKYLELFLDISELNM